ncbi:CDP-alcohol phosphatidyltransferase family protein [Natronoglycomyces albus]|uniref:CDP-alcohol phosphatidyltransferase family protein n=1 Tax=Natronoglycomyces albus TaxID=2811108 RepID=UPI001FE245A4|nr:CDP-alcohol phosphatidyltransferase family protein [Natronoglycomyces albus]
MRPAPWRRHRTDERATKRPRTQGRFARGHRSRALARRIRVKRRRHDPDEGPPWATTPTAAPISPAPIATQPSPPAAADIDFALADDEAPPTPIPLLPGRQTLRRRLYFALANLCTVISIGLGVSAILLASQGHITWAATVLLGCVIMDGIDGPLARRLGVASPFGAQMDSLADMCSFGVAAPVVALLWLHGDTPVWVAAPACALLAACAAIRLARFNISPKDGRYFSGVPTTLAAMVLALAILISPNPQPAAFLMVAGLALFMVSGFPYAKVGHLARLPVYLWSLPIVGFWLDAELTFTVIICVYLASGPLLWLHHRRHQGSPLSI